MKIHIIYISKLWSYLQKLVRSKGEGYLFVGKFFVAVLLVVGSVNGVRGQEIKPLKNGELIPDAVWLSPLQLTYFNGEQKVITLSDLRGKLILFDFWATTCPSCIEGIPKMEDYQKQYKDSIVVILVNSKRNKDTPQKIQNTVKRYKETYGYTIALPTLYDDTLFTQLFPHNTIPNVAWISPEGRYLANSFSSSVNTELIRDVLQKGIANIPSVNIIRNRDRNTTPPLIDTVGVKLLSVFTGHVKDYLGVYPNLIHKNGNSLYQIGNYSLPFILGQAYAEELKGFTWTDYAFDPRLDNGFKKRLFSDDDVLNSYWYQLYVADTITQKDAVSMLRKDIARYFNVEIIRKNGNIDIYHVTTAKDIEKIRSKSKMSIISPFLDHTTIKLQNVKVRSLIIMLARYFDRPLQVEIQDDLNIDIILPKGFPNFPLEDKIEFLQQHGFKITAQTVSREYPYFQMTN
ncbi:TlpA family protein disulfide reductase [Sphingobacterium kitahiroshimense]|uniref:TlpA disulfide reductase family protein n=1 Tax=Sphingobacterium kitahiroshimense TaxID=470446 RepID=A0ABV0BNY9_9SPHI